MNKQRIAILVALCCSGSAHANDLNWDTGAWDLAHWQEGGNTEYLDTDGDSVLNLRDEDDDNDGYADRIDAFPLDPNDWEDSDNDGLGDNYELALGLDPNSPDSDGDGLLDSEDPFPLTKEPVKTIRYVNWIQDVNNDGISDLAIVYQDENDVVTASLYDKVNDELIRSFRFPGTYDSFSTHLFSDKNSNLSQEIGIFGLTFDSESNAGVSSKLIIKDTLSSETIDVFSWPGNWNDPTFVVLEDLTSDGIAEIGMQGQFYIGDRPQLLVRDGASGDQIRRYSFPSIMYNSTYVQLSDMNNDTIPEVGMIGVIKRNNKVQVKVIDGTDDSNNLPAINFGNDWTEYQWLSLPDINFDTVTDGGLYGRRLSSSSIQLFTKSGIDKAGTLGIYSWPDDLLSHQPTIVDDLNFDGVNDFAVGGFRESAGRYQLIIKDATDRSETLANVGWPNTLQSPVFHDVNDIDGDGVRDFVLAGFRIRDHKFEVAVKNINNSKVENFVSDNNWKEAPKIVPTPDITGDGLPDIVMYGYDELGTSILEVLSFN
ncbi:MAG: hypothetical protein GYB34_12295 [Gammaproteobacteria bacterium]|nr:hypothetical protein [Gammaproteobacteria bacterium]|tara:strand:+ start:4605 stop:6224 length:1620 start_codon:yes stop_codon:yes gene_type:complete